MNKCEALIRTMQLISERYLTPEPYVDRLGKVVVNEPQRTEAFVNDMIGFLDGPEQRAAFAERNEHVEDMKVIIRDLLRVLAVTDHTVFVESDIVGQRRTLLASNFIL